MPSRRLLAVSVLVVLPLRGVQQTIRKFVYLACLRRHAPELFDGALAAAAIAACIEEDTRPSV